jgi:hypothetical protein
VKKIDNTDKNINKKVEEVPGLCTDKHLFIFFWENFFDDFFVVF